MKKTLCLFFVILFILPCTGCFIAENYHKLFYLESTFRLAGPEEDISKVSIITAEFTGQGEYGFNETELVHIQDIDTFIADFRNTTYYSRNFGEPTTVFGYNFEYTSVTVIKIEYSNGNFDLICQNAASCYKKGYANNEMNWYRGTGFFDEAQFEALMDKYLP